MHLQVSQLVNPGHGVAPVGTAAAKVDGSAGVSVLEKEPVPHPRDQDSRTRKHHQPLVNHVTLRRGPGHCGEAHCGQALGLPRPAPRLHAVAVNESTRTRLTNRTTRSAGFATERCLCNGGPDSAPL